jgi:hypothetical protein
LIKFKFGFENLLKICFEKLEKEKGKEFLFFSGRFLPQPTARPALPARGPLPHSCAIFRVGRAQARPAGPTRARSHSESLTRGARLSVSPSTFPFFLLPTTAGFSFLPPPTESAAKSLPFPSLPMPSGYKNGITASPRSIFVHKSQP